MRRSEKGFLAVPPRLHRATHLQEARPLLDRTSQTRLEGRARPGEAESIARREIPRQPRTSRDISMILLALPSQVHHRIYKSESASKEIGATQRSNLRRSSHLAIRADLMQVAEGVSDLAIEADEQAKVHDTGSSSSRPCSTRRGAWAWAHTILPGSPIQHLWETPSRVDCISNLRRVRAILCEGPVSTKQFEMDPKHSRAYRS